jgi:hypothetical protein
VTARRTAPVGLLLVVLLLAACGSSGDTSDGGAGARGTHLVIEGTATTATTPVPPDANGSPPIPDPSDATEVDISGSVRCDSNPTGTGAYASTVTVATICADLAKHRGALEQPEPGDDQVCAEVYGGPQHATIRGTVDGAPVDVSVHRTNSCGIDRWETLQWLLGPPER